MGKKIMRVLVCEPGKEPYVRRIEKSKDAVDKFLGGVAKAIFQYPYTVWHTQDEDIRDSEVFFEKSKDKTFLITGHGGNGLFNSVDSIAVNWLHDLFNSEEALIKAELQADNKAANKTNMCWKRFERSAAFVWLDYSSTIGYFELDL